MTRRTKRMSDSDWDAELKRLERLAKGADRSKAEEAPTKSQREDTKRRRPGASITPPPPNKPPHRKHRSEELPDQILRIIEQREDVSVNDVVRELGEKPSRVRHALGELEHAGAVLVARVMIQGEPVVVYSVPLGKRHTAAGKPVPRPAGYGRVPGIRYVGIPEIVRMTAVDEPPHGLVPNAVRKWFTKANHFPGRVQEGKRWFAPYDEVIEYLIEWRAKR